MCESTHLPSISSVAFAGRLHRPRALPLIAATLLALVSCGDNQVPPTPSCGDGVLDPGELCDDGNTTAGDGCSADCASDETCGNGVLDLAEACDDGNTTAGDGCSADCASDETCGNGIIDLGELCDDGNNLGGDGCAADCASDETCGNGVPDPGEVCDDGNNQGGDGCSPGCTLESCGDGTLDVGETCDDGNNQSGDGCSADCTSDETCGNGIIDIGEVCDDGNNQSGDGCSSGCISDETCGNGILDIGEVCDDGNNQNGDGCSADCTSDETCGNGIIDTGETCDDGNTTDGDGCSADCASDETCGNGILDTGEACDDGNTTGGDGCSADCASDETCGNGIIDPGETCDDGNTVDGDGCPATCVAQSNNVDIALGSRRTCVLRDDGTVRCWGRGSRGQLGYGNTETWGDDETLEQLGPVALGGAAVQLVSGHFHTCALLATGAVRCWGMGDDGVLGYGNTNDIGDDETPAAAGDVPIGGTVVQLAAGIAHTCALLDTGAVRCWGEGSFGRLGYGNTADIGDNETPASAGDVDVGPGTVVQVAGGAYHSCVLLDTGAVRCWGDGGDGALGYGNFQTIGDNESPSTAGDVPVGAPVAKLALNGHTCALLTNGGVRCWGPALFGRLGYGNTLNIGDDETPASVGDVPVGAPLVDISAGTVHTCGVTTTGAARCWGVGTNGRTGLGHEHVIGDDEPASAATDAMLGGVATRVVAGVFHSCALLDTGRLRCFGAGESGALGYGDTLDIGDSRVASEVGDLPLGGTAVQLATRDSHTCAVLDTGAVRCWGNGDDAQLGYGVFHVGDDETPASVGDVPVGGLVASVAAGGDHTCAVMDTGAVRCWGSGSVGQLGYGNTNTIGNNETPASAGDVPLGALAVAITTGLSHSCARTDTDAVRCWGYNGWGQLGYGNTLDIGDDELPSTVGDVAVGGDVLQVSGGRFHTCALLSSNRVRCWGRGGGGTLGYGNTQDIGDDELPSTAGDVDVGGDVVEIAAGDYHTCARLSTGTVRCWGNILAHGVLDIIGDDETPASAGDIDLGAPALQVSSGGDHTCVVLAGGGVRCFGDSFLGQLGYGDTFYIGDDELPSSVGLVPVGGTVAQVAAGQYHTCALLDTGGVRCWGRPVDGELGYGDTEPIGRSKTSLTVGDVPYI